MVKLPETESEMRELHKAVDHRLGLIDAERRKLAWCDSARKAINYFTPEFGTHITLKIPNARGAHEWPDLRLPKVEVLSIIERAARDARVRLAQLGATP